MQKIGERGTAACPATIIRPSAARGKSIFSPIKVRTKASPYFRYGKRSARSASRKKNVRKPSIAKIFEVYTKKRSVVIPKIAGIESTAKTRSVNSITIKNEQQQRPGPRTVFYYKELIAVIML